MFLLAADLAIFRRLTGAPLDSKGRPVLGADGRPTNRWVPGPPELNGVRQPSYGIQLPMLKAPHDTAHGLTSRDPDAFRPFELGFDPRAVNQVAVFDQNTENRKWEDIWPCVTYGFKEMAPNLKTSVYGSPFVQYDPAADPVDIVDEFGNVVQSGRSGLLVTPHPDAFDLTYAIRTYAKSHIESRLLEDQILSLFPARGSIEIDFMDGAVHVCDMSLQWTQDLNLRGEDVKKSLDPSEQAHYSKAFFYTIEGYVDNSANKFGHHDVLQMQAITNCILEICAARDSLDHGPQSSEFITT